MRALSLVAMSLMLIAGFVRAAEGPASQPSSQPAKEGVIEATDNDALKAAVGKTATVHGKVSGTFTPRSGSVLLINFEGTNRNFTVAVPKASLDAVNSAFSGDVAAAVKGKGLNVTGEIKLYKNKPEIEVTKPEQIKIEEAKE